MPLSDDRKRKDDAGPTVSEVLAAVSKSGYLLEHDVATELEALGFSCSTGVPYEDPEEGKSREYDVGAWKHYPTASGDGPRIHATLIVECKNTRNPFVVFSRSKGWPHGSKNPKEVLFSVPEVSAKIGSGKPGEPTRSRVTSRFLHLGLHEAHYFYSRESKGVQACRLVRPKKEWEVDQNAVFQSIVQPMAKAVLARRKQVFDSRGHRWEELVFPLVVTSGPLFEVDTSLDTVEPVEVPYVGCCRQFDSKTLKGVFQFGFVTKNALADFVRDQVDSLMESLVEIENESPGRLQSKEAFEGHEFHPDVK